MYWRRIEANWPQFRPLVAERWARLDEVRLAAIAGRRAQLVREIQAAYDVTAEEAEKEVAEWQRYQALKSPVPQAGAPGPAGG